MDKSEKLYEIISLIRPLTLKLARAVEIELSESGLNLAQRAILEWLHRNKKGTVPQIGRRLGFKRQYIQRLVIELIDFDYVNKESNPDHKTSYLLSLSTLGEEKIKVVLSKEKRNLQKVGKNLRSEDIERCYETLEQLYVSFSNEEHWKED